MDLEPHVTISAVFGGYVVGLLIGDVQMFHTCGSLRQVQRLVKAHLESLEETKEDEPVEVCLEEDD